LLLLRLSLLIGSKIVVGLLWVSLQLVRRLVGRSFRSQRGTFFPESGTLVSSILRLCVTRTPRFTWTMRIFGFILLAVLGVSNLVCSFFSYLSSNPNPCLQLMKRRLPPRDIGGGILNIRAFESASYSVYCCSAFVTFLGIYTRTSG